MAKLAAAKLGRLILDRSQPVSTPGGGSEEAGAMANALAGALDRISAQLRRTGDIRDARRALLRLLGELE